MTTKFRQLETRFEEQENALKTLENDRRRQISANSEGANTELDPIHPPSGKKVFPRTCREALVSNPLLPSGMYWIDPDGSATGDDPIYVHCDMETGDYRHISFLSISC